MGQAKALLTCPDGRTFVRTLADALCDGGIAMPLIVGRPDDDRLRLEVEAIGQHARLVMNEDADNGGQLSSLVAGLREADRPGIRALMVVPVDAPLVTPETVATLIAAFSATRAPIVRARFQGRNGHPVIFSRAVFDELLTADPQVGAKAVLRVHASAIVNVDVEDPAVIGDVDTPEDYHRLIDHK